MASYYNENTVLFLNGAFVKAADAKMDLYSQSLHYGYSVFEGIRSYKTEDGTTKIFKATEHFDRFKISAEAINLPYTYNTQDLIEQTYKLLELNNLGDAYIRPVVYAPANMSFSQNTESFIFIQAWEMGPFLGDKRIRVMTSSFQRPNPKGFKLDINLGELSTRICDIGIPTEFSLEIADDKGLKLGIKPLFLSN